MEAVYAFETSVHFYQISRRYVPEGSILGTFVVQDFNRTPTGRNLQSTENSATLKATEGLEQP
jgi:hypothetical protein